MKKSELFALLAGLVGFIADFITITLFFKQRTSGAASTMSIVSLQTLVIFTMIYGWFITTWMIARRHWVSARSKDSSTLKYAKGVWAQNELFRRVAYIVTGIGLILLPFSMALPINERIPANDFIQWFAATLVVNIIALALVGSGILFSITSLMPIVYSDLSQMFEEHSINL